MGFESKLKEVQTTLVEQKISGWLLYDFRGSNALAYAFLEIPANRFFSRRFFYWIPQQGQPMKIVSAIESHTLDFLPGDKKIYRTWQELEAILFAIGKTHPTIAMEYSIDNSLPIVSKVDAGTVDLIRKTGTQVVSSANLLQKYTSVWTDQQLQSHLFAANVLEQIAERTWQFISAALQSEKRITEYDVQQRMLEQMHQQGCVTDHAPICAVNAHSADPHYAPEPTTALPIRSGDFILIDLWCKQDIPQAVYADIARVGVAANTASSKQLEVFEIVKKAKEQAIHFLRKQYGNHQDMQGWQIDQICRDCIGQSGYGDYFIHRTGHNIGEQVHGLGANLDNFETHDFRLLLPGTCFSLEPGIYLPDQFGIRLESDVYLDPKGEVMITGGLQEAIVCLK